MKGDANAYFQGSWFSTTSTGVLKLEHSCLAFEEFPDARKTGEHIAKWLEGNLDFYGLTPADIILFSPDGCKAGLSPYITLRDKTF